MANNQHNPEQIVTKLRQVVGLKSAFVGPIGIRASQPI